MTKPRAENAAGYGRVPREPVVSGLIAGLRRADLAVYLCLCSHVGSDWTAWPSVDRLAVQAGVHRRTAQRSLRRLQALKLVRLGRPGGGARRPAVYIVNLSPFSSGRRGANSGAPAVLGETVAPGGHRNGETVAPGGHGTGRNGGPQGPRKGDGEAEPWPNRGETVASEAKNGGEASPSEQPRTKGTEGDETTRHGAADFASYLLRRSINDQHDDDGTGEADEDGSAGGTPA